MPEGALGGRNLGHHHAFCWNEHRSDLIWGLFFHTSKASAFKKAHDS